MKMTRTEFELIWDIEKHLSRIVELFELMDAHLRNLESSLIKQNYDCAPSTPQLQNLKIF